MVINNEILDDILDTLENAMEKMFLENKKKYDVRAEPRGE